MVCPRRASQGLDIPDFPELFPYTGLYLYSRQRYSQKNKHSTNETSLYDSIV